MSGLTKPKADDTECRPLETYSQNGIFDKNTLRVIYSFLAPPKKKIAQHHSSDVGSTKKKVKK